MARTCSGVNHTGAFGGAGGRSTRRHGDWATIPSNAAAPNIDANRLYARRTADAPAPSRDICRTHACTSIRVIDGNNRPDHTGSTHLLNVPASERRVSSSTTRASPHRPRHSSYDTRAFLGSTQSPRRIRASWTAPHSRTSPFNVDVYVRRFPSGR